MKHRRRTKRGRLPSLMVLRRDSNRTIMRERNLGHTGCARTLREVYPHRSPPRHRTISLAGASAADRAPLLVLVTCSFTPRRWHAGPQSQGYHARRLTHRVVAGSRLASQPRLQRPATGPRTRAGAATTTSDLRHAIAPANKRQPVRMGVIRH